MKSDRLRLLIALLSFAAWIGWLGYLALTATRPVVLSRPQFLVAQLDVLAEVSERDGRPLPAVVVRQVLHPREDLLTPGADETIEVANLPSLTHKEGWTGPGLYIIPLVRNDAQFHVAAIPRSPGYPGGAPRIYLRSPQTLEQQRQIREPK